MSGKKLTERITADEARHGSMPFWSWNDKLNKDELIRQINVMHELGMKGFFMHARTGLETEYLSDEWYDCINACVNEAERLGMEAWSYDENGWPSGFGGGILLENEKNLSVYITHTVSKEYPIGEELLNADNNETPGGKLLCVCTLEGRTMQLVNSPVEGAEYHIFRLVYDDSYVDTMDPRITAEFIRVTHEDYKRHISPEQFGKSMPGFFTDEPQYYRWRTPWSRLLPERFLAEYGYDVREAVPSLFLDYDGAREARYDYHRLCHYLFIDGFIKPVYEWCIANGASLTGHAVEENTLSGQMWCCGGVMPFYEYETIPGVDYLGRGLISDVNPKQLGSACSQLGKKHTISEMFACCGWDVTPRELKRIAELQYANGVNSMCQHLYAYSIRGQKKRDFPAFYSEHLPWQQHMKDFNRYFDRLGAALEQGEEVAPILVLHPIHSAWLDYNREQDRASIRKNEENLLAISNYLSQQQLPYHYGDEVLMSKYGSVNGNRITVGKCTYSYVVVPDCETLDSTTAELLKQYLKGGGKLCIFGAAPTRIDGRIADLSWLVPNMTVEELSTAAEATLRDGGMNLPGMRMQVRSFENENGGASRLFFITNLTENRKNGITFTVRNCKGLTRIDLDTMQETFLPGMRDSEGSFTTLLDFDDSEGILLTENDGKAIPTDTGNVPKELRLPESFRIKGSLQNFFNLDKAMVSEDGGDYSSLKTVNQIRDELLQENFRGRLTLAFPFTAESLPKELSVVVEPMRNPQLLCNGKPVTISDNWLLDRCFRTADIAGLTKVGANVLEISFDYYQRDEVQHVLYGGVSETLRNCLWFDTEVENLILAGSFTVRSLTPWTDGEKHTCLTDGPFVLAAADDNIELALRNLPEEGYPFFCGSITAEADIMCRGTSGILRLPGRYSVAEVSVNGNAPHKLLFSNSCDLSGELTDGTNHLEITVWNSGRNLWGPHHHVDPEPYGVSPSLLSEEKAWHDGKCAAHSDRYAFVHFGIR